MCLTAHHSAPQRSGGTTVPVEASFSSQLCSSCISDARITGMIGSDCADWWRAGGGFVSCSSSTKGVKKNHVIIKAMSCVRRDEAISVLKTSTIRQKCTICPWQSRYCRSVRCRISCSFLLGKKLISLFAVPNRPSARVTHLPPTPLCPVLCPAALCQARSS